jgi:hypothetical protein
MLQEDRMKRRLSAIRFVTMRLGQLPGASYSSGYSMCARPARLMRSMILSRRSCQAVPNRHSSARNLSTRDRWDAVVCTASAAITASPAIDVLAISASFACLFGSQAAQSLPHARVQEIIRTDDVTVREPAAARKGLLPKRPFQSVPRNPHLLRSQD